MSTVSLSPSTLIIDSCVMITLRFSALAFAFAIKHNDAPVSHKTFANPFLVVIFCIWSKLVSVSLLHALAVLLAKTMFFFFYKTVHYLQNNTYNTYLQYEVLTLLTILYSTLYVHIHLHLHMCTV